MFWIFVPFLVASTTAGSLTAEEYSQLPRLFHLDDYDKCLSVRDGLYCLGVFELTPTHEPHTVYDLMKNHTEGTFNFNRTLIHRGYCLNKRCPSRETNTTKYFEQCANVWAKTQAMRANLRTLHYCRTTKDLQVIIPRNNEQELFIQVCYAILLLNIVGTAYDFMTGTGQNKNKLLIAWSIPVNWHKLTVIHKGGDARLTALEPVQGAKVFGIFCVMYAHNYAYHYGFHVTNPDFLEQMPVRSAGLFVSNGMLLVHMFFMITTFLTTYNMLLYSEKQPLSVSMLPLLLIKRISRICPLYLLVIGFMATWWPYLNDGPLWPAMAVTESKICRDKFLPHALFLNNLIEPEKYCVMPSWYLAVDIQMYIVAVTVTLLLARLRRGRIIVLFIALVASIVLNAVLAYIFHWKPMLYFSTVTEDIRTLFRDVPSFTRLYVSPWGNLPACFIGLIVGHLYPAMINSNFDVNKYKCVLNIAYLILIPALFCWLLLGNFIQHIQDRIFVTVYAAAERSIFQIMCLLIYIMLNVINNFMISLFAWQGWQAVARLSLSVMLLHWCVNMMLVLPLPQPVPTSAINILTIGVATTSFTFVLALPLTLLVEIPMMKFFHVMLSS